MAKGDLKADVVTAITANAVIGNALNTAMFTDTGSAGLMAWEVAKTSDASEYFVIFYRGAPENGVSLQMRDALTGGGLMQQRYDMGQAEVLQTKDLLALLLSLVDRMYNAVP